MRGLRRALSGNPKARTTATSPSPPQISLTLETDTPVIRDRETLTMQEQRGIPSKYYLSWTIQARSNTALLLNSRTAEPEGVREKAGAGCPPPIHQPGHRACQPQSAVPAGRGRLAVRLPPSPCPQRQAAFSLPDPRSPAWLAPPGAGKGRPRVRRTPGLGRERKACSPLPLVPVGARPLPPRFR